MSKSKARGTRFESEVRDRLNEIDGVEAKRVVGSGMFAQGDVDSDLFGDVRAQTRLGEIVVECKWRSNSGWKTLVKWMGEEQALVMRAPHEEPFVFLRWGLFAKLLEGGADRPAPDGLSDEDFAELSQLILKFLKDRSARV